MTVELKPCAFCKGPADPHQDDVTWCVDKINASDTLYIRADLSASPQVATPAVQELDADDIASACLSYRNDFGLLPEAERRSLMCDAAAWAHALGHPIKFGTAAAITAAPAPQPTLIADAARVIEWARSKPRKPAQSAFTDGPERQAAYWIEWAESAAPQPSLDVEKEREDAARFRWLTEDHADADTRDKCRELLARMSVMSYAAACRDIDAARAEKESNRE